MSTKTSSARMLPQRKEKSSEREDRIKPFGFCCSVDRFDPLSRYDRRMPPYESSLTAITSVHECPVTKMLVEFPMPLHSQEKKRLAKFKASEVDDRQSPSKIDRLSYQTGSDEGSIKWYLEDEIALARDLFWMEKQRAREEKSKRELVIAKEKVRKADILEQDYPRWYQDFSFDQMKNLTSLEKAMRTDHEEIITTGTQTVLMAIGVTSTFFELKPNVIRELHGSCNLNDVRFLREIYRIYTGSDFQKEGYKKSYDCNERIILSAIAFLTLPETVKELHSRLPAVIIPKLPPKPKPPLCPARQRSVCPYKDEQFVRPDWVRYRKDYQEWLKQVKVFPVPRIILPFGEYNQSLIADDQEIEISKKREKNSYDLEEISAKESQETCADPRHEDEVVLSAGYSDAEKSDILDVPQLPDENKWFDFTITGLGEKPGAVKYNICGTLEPSGMKQKSWLGEKDVHYIIAGASDKPPSCPVTYEITGLAAVTPSNSDEKFFAVLKLGDGPKKIFPSGRENLSRNWQEWLQNADEEFRQVEREANRLVESVRATTRLMFPGPTCDACCSCRQTRKTREKLQRTKTPYLLIDNVLQDGENNYIVGSMALHSPAPSPAGSAVNLLEVIASQDEIKTNVIVNGITSENGVTQYYISGIQRDKVHVPSRIPDPPEPDSVRNVPPCACAVQQLFNGDMSLSSVSKDDIPWTKDEGLCLGKKYRPDEPGAYSCKMYPGDKSCRRNPFTKDIERMKRKREEGDDDKRNGKFSEVVEEQAEMPKKVTAKKRGRFVPDPDYPAYDDPWNISRIAPSAIVLETDYEKSLKLTPAVLPEILSPPRTFKKQKDTPSKIPREPQQIAVVESTDEKASRMTVSLKSPRTVQQERRKEPEDARKKKNKTRIPSESASTAGKGAKVLNKISKLVAPDGTKKRQAKFSSTDQMKTIRRQQLGKPRKHGPAKRDGKRSAIDVIDELGDRKQEMTRLKNMMKSVAEALGDVQPVVLPWERLPGSEDQLVETGESSIASIDEEESRAIVTREPCGWKTKSEQELPAKKTLAYLCEPDYPLETIAVRPGGQPCRCRENRGKKKILMYNVSGIVDENKDGKKVGRRNGERKLKEESRIIDGIVYFTPSVSPRRSDEYVPEYELLESPYETCVGKAADKGLKLIERYSGPKSLTEKIRRKAEPYSCSGRTVDTTRENGLADRKKDAEETRRKVMESKSPEERWTTALKDEGLTDHFVHPENKAACWTTCAKYGRSIRPRKLKVKKPVCECKYERKILERNEERTNWRARQRKLKALKKQPFMHIVDTSRPMVPDSKFIISGVKRIPREDEYADDVKYCITGVAEHLSMSSPQQIVDGLKMSTPCETPVPSVEDLSQKAAPHLHWSPTNVLPGPLPRKDAAKKAEMERRRKVRDEAARLIYGDQSERDEGCILVHDNCQRADLETKRNDTSTMKRAPEALMEPLLSDAERNGKKRHRQDVSSEKIVEVAREKKKRLEEAIDGIDQPDQGASYERPAERISEESDNEGHRANGNGDGKRPDKLKLMAIVKAELKKMAAEGYVFAELPECHVMPQLRDWIMYRQGVAFSETEKKRLMVQTTEIWHRMDRLRRLRIKQPSLDITKSELEGLTYDRVQKMKKKIKERTAIFHSDVRKFRVLQARTMWNTMKFGKFPSASFKRAYFTYAAGKEADGHIFKPWTRVDVRERDPNFSCPIKC